jgi:exonuclease SbcC
MRPISLIMRAFGPYAKEQLLDFRSLGSSRLFLICGPTGAGKSTIIDAMCYALFGQSSGAEREPSQLRSDHATAEDPTEVVFEFSVGAERYRIRRSPDQPRPSKRGGGITREPTRAALWRLAADGTEGEVLAARPSEVDTRVKDFLGFDADQFRQVVVLPQGQFQKFLNASDRDREDILEVLFDTAFYRRIEAELKNRASALETVYKEIRAKAVAIFAPYDALDRTDLASALESLRTEESKAATELERAEAAEEAASKSAEEGRQRDRVHKELTEAEAALAKVEKGREEQEERRRCRRRGLRAAPLMQHVEKCNETQAEVAATKAAADSALDHLGKATQRVKTAADAFRIEASREETRREAGRKVDELARLVVKVEGLEQVRADAESARVDYEKDAKEVERLERLKTELDIHYEQLRRELEALRLTAKDRENQDLLAKELKRVLNVRRKAEELAAGLKRVEGTLEETRLREASVGKAYERAEKALEHVELSWLGAQAGRLAKGLVAGEPCPVCGSRQHPNPARATEEAPDEAALKKAQLEVKKAAGTLQVSREARVQEENRRNALVEKSVDFRAAEGEYSGVTTTVLERSLAKAEDATIRAKEAELAIPKKEAELNSLTVTRTQAEKNLKESERKVGTLRDKLRSEERAVKELEKEFPENLTNKLAIARALKAAKKYDEELRSAWERCRQEDQEAQKAEAVCRRAKELAVSAAAQAKEKADAAEAQLTANLTASGFKDQADFISACLSEKQLDALEKAIETWDKSLATAEERRNRAKTASEGTLRPDVRALEAAFKAAQRVRREASELRGRLRQSVDAAEKALQTVSELEKEGATVDFRYRIVARVAETASGQNPRGISLNRFVLAARLEDVLAQASVRLTTMSRGRFRLKRGEEREDRRRAGGLELSVFDSYTGKERPVKTLSGGEGFLAALCLALGLSDVVQAAAGGVRLESMFVDEGFGSLDPDALEAAVQVLEDLQQSGRLVGIISHVPELREWIPPRLEVIAGPRGSSARFVV